MDARNGCALKPGERLDDLQAGGFRLIQRSDCFRFGTDAVLLADFAAPRPKDTAADLGCGTGAIAILMAAHCPKLTVDCAEIQPEIADMARRSVILNGLEDRLRVYEADMRTFWRVVGAQRYTLVVCNPPYHRAGGAIESRTEAERTARHEGDLTPDAIADSASRLLRSRGRFCAVYPARRAYELMRAMDEHRIAPKRLRPVQIEASRAPKLILIEGVKDGGSQLDWQPPLILRNEDGTPSPEWHRIYDPKPPL